MSEQTYLFLEEVVDVVQIVRRSVQQRTVEQIVDGLGGELIPQERTIRGSIDHVVQSFVSAQPKHP